MSAQKPPASPRCHWYVNDDGAWIGVCGTTWEFTEGGPKENEMRYCPRCGWRILEVQPVDEMADRVRKLEAEVERLRRAMNEACNYSIDLQRAIEAHCHGARVGEYGLSVRARCQHHADMLNADLAQRDTLLEALRDISSFHGKALLGDGRYDEGANAAFEQAADIAAAAIARVTGEAKRRIEEDVENA